MTSFDDPKRCRFCARPMRWKRAHAIYCGNTCRSDASRLRRLLDGAEVDGYTSVIDFVMTRRERTTPPEAPSNASDGRKRPRRPVAHPTLRDGEEASS